MPTAPTQPRVRLQPRRLLALCDLVGAIVTLVVARELLAWRDVQGWARLVALLALGLTFLLTLAWLAHRGQYSVGRRLSRLSDVIALGGTLVVAAAIVILLQYASKGFFTHVTDPPRSVVLGGWLLFFVLATLARVFLALYERHLFAKGLALRRILLVGGGQAAADFARFLEQRPWLGALCVGRAMFCPDAAGRCAPAAREQSDNAQSPPDNPVCLTATLEGLESLHQAMRATGASEIVVALDEEESHFMPELTRLLTLAHVPFRIVPSLFDATFAAARIAGFLEIPVVDVQVDPLTRFQRIVKRQVDIAVALVALLVGLIPSLFIALAIRLESRGPVFFMQERVGKNGRHFWMYKFRTMVADAEEKLEKLR
ncbi:MAG: sugar transferase, partial [Thermoleophilia bacterium]|nr:sugar transferase [Thermoleophilia bacterium]